MGKNERHRRGNRAADRRHPCQQAKTERVFRHTSDEHAYGSACGYPTGHWYYDQRLRARQRQRRVFMQSESLGGRGMRLRPRQASHKINLFDMAMKYADVMPLKEAIDYIRGLPDNLFAPAL